MSFFDPVLLIFILIFLAFGFNLLSKLIFQLRVMYFPWGKSQVIDVTSENIPPFDAAYEVIQRLENLGFEPLGTARVVLFWRRHLPGYAWYYVDQAKTTHAQIVEFKPHQPALVALFTWFADDALIETYYPIGATIDEPNLCSHFVKEDLEHGYRFHQSKLKEWSVIHGAPDVVRSVNQVIHYDRVNMRRHHRRHNRRLILLSLLIIFTMIGNMSVLIVGGLLISFPIISDLAQRVQVAALIGSFFLFGLVLFFGLLYLYQNPSGALDDKRKSKVS